MSDQGVPSERLGETRVVGLLAAHDLLRIGCRPGRIVDRHRDLALGQIRERAVLGARVEALLHRALRDVVAAELLLEALEDHLSSNSRATSRSLLRSISAAISSSRLSSTSMSVNAVASCFEMRASSAWLARFSLRFAPEIFSVFARTPSRSPYSLSS